MTDQDKIAAYTWLLQDHYLLQTYVVAEECPGMPKHLNGLTRLDIGLNLRVPVLPLTVDATGITAGLSFGGQRALVTIPWQSLIGVKTEDDGFVCLFNAAAKARAEASTPVTKPAAVARWANPAPRPVAQHDGNVVRVDFAARRRVQS